MVPRQKRRIQLLAFCAKGVLWILPSECTYKLDKPRDNLVHFSYVVCIGWIFEEWLREKKWKEFQIWWTTHSIGGKVLQLVELHPKGARWIEVQKLSVLVRAATPYPFQSTNTAVVWKMEGAGKRWNLSVTSWCAHWCRTTFYNGGFALAITRIDASRDGDARSTAWCDNHAGWRVQMCSEHAGSNRACELGCSTASAILSTLERTSFAQCNSASTVKHPSVQAQA